MTGEYRLETEVQLQKTTIQSVSLKFSHNDFTRGFQHYSQLHIKVHDFHLKGLISALTSDNVYLGFVSLLCVFQAAHTCFIVSKRDRNDINESNKSLLPSWVLYKMLKVNNVMN